MAVEVLGELETELPPRNPCNALATASRLFPDGPELFKFKHALCVLTDQGNGGQCLLDAFEDISVCCVQQWELISGPDLLDLLNEHGGRMPEEVTAFYFYQLVKGVVFMHENGFCHRDLKPENCMVEKHTQLLKIIDFGLSKHINSVNTLG
ncbi:unnamed protein product [Ostreobium quekettii]|uniref:Protein kinase domain-containing protein n=1 Tax=Ostreobium quekettii TaxID=121088 RepID=A0A8S1JDF9_9CHLO|nr:unnamed protein product [Ostreobium quekettii]